MRGLVVDLQGLKIPKIADFLSWATRSMSQTSTSERRLLVRDDLASRLLVTLEPREDLGRASLSLMRVSGDHCCPASVARTH